MGMKDEGVGLPTKAPVEAAPAPDRAGKIPEFVGMPMGREREFYSGLRRGMIMSLVLPCAANKFSPPVKSVTTRRPGTSRGNRLIVLEGKFGKQLGLLTYLRKLRDEQTPNEREAA